MIIDSHCHYQLPPFWPNSKQGFNELISAAKLQGIRLSLVPSVDGLSSAKAIELSRQHSFLRPMVGAHPGEIAEQHPTPVSLSVIEEWVEKQLAQIGELLATNQDIIIAVGEIGLDYYRLDQSWIPSDKLIQLQQKLFNSQLNLAMKYHLPVSLHIRDQVATAYQQVIETVLKIGSPSQTVWHCLSGQPSEIQKFIAAGGYVGIAGNITYQGKRSDQLRDIVKSLPREQILVETDAPFLPPQSQRGQVCLPAMISETVEFLSSQLNINQDQLTANTISAFRLTNLSS